MILTNAFSLQMLTNIPATITVEEVVPSKEMLESCDNSLGHKDICDLLNGMFGTSLAPNRKSDKLSDGDTVLVAQYIGSRLPEGAITLPEGATLKFLKVTVNY